VLVLEAFSTPQNRTVSFVFLAACCASAIAAVAVGINDNPPGILLAFLAAAAFVLVFVHPWRTARQFKFLFYISVLGLALFAILHNVLEAVASTWASAGALHIPLEGLSVAAFLLAVLVCPPAFLIGAVGWVTMSIRNRRRPAQSRGGAA
jgi:hypothetical protein